MQRCASRLATLVAAFVAFGVPLSALAYNLSGERWPGNSITLHLQLGSSEGTLLDGNNSWGESAEDALAAWNSNMTNMRFLVVRDSAAALGSGNGINNVFWSSTVYGDAWDARTIAMAVWRTNLNSVRLEADVIFNDTRSWNSYRGALLTAAGGGTLFDFQRVALHEFGHVLGLGHPDDIGQRVAAVMNANTSNTDALTPDDIAGARAIYDSGTIVTGGVRLYMQNPVSFRITGPTTVNLQATRVQNDRPAGNTSGSLRLDLWAMPSPFDNGLPTGSRLLGRYSFPEVLQAGLSYPNVNVNVAYTAPPNGTYHVALVLGEFIGGSGSGWTIRDFRQFDTQLTIGPVAAPAIVAQPFSQSVRAGGTARFSVIASGAAPLAYQWRRDGVALTGATAASLTLTPSLPNNAGNYTVVVTNAAGSVTSSVATLAVNYSRLVNLSTRAQIQPGAVLTPGFVMRGTGAKQLVIRGIGPTLSQFGIGTALADIRLEVIPSGSTSPQISNDDWTTGGPSLSAAFTAVGAFALPVPSRDAAVQSNFAVNSGGYTVRLSPTGGATSGVALAEIYDRDSDNSSAQLINVSTLGFVGTGDNVLTPGFTIRGNSSKRLLIRAVGPGLAQFGVGGLLADPQLAVFPARVTVTPLRNDDWGGTANLKAAFAAAGAFTIADNSRDAAIVVNLSPGGYTVVVSGFGNTTGNALVEIYDLDP